MCAGGRSDEDAWGARFHAGKFGDASLQRRPHVPGYTIVKFHPRHVSDVIDLTDEELSGFWADVRTAGNKLRAVFGPCHLNYQLLGNAVPHTHVHLLPRYDDDTPVGAPLPWRPAEELEELPPEELQRQVAQLRTAAGD
jgi:diadenosine tetraphosphate (Ap4A) HIT family hydrolase